MDVGDIALGLSDLRGEHNMLASQVNQSLQILTSHVQALQADSRRSAESNAEQLVMLHELKERSTGLERLARAIENGDGRLASHITNSQKVADQVTHLRGLLAGIVLVGGIGLGGAVGYIVFRFDSASNERAEMRADIKVMQQKLGVRP